MKRAMTFILLVGITAAFAFNVNVPGLSRFREQIELRQAYQVMGQDPSSITERAITSGISMWIPVGLVLHFIAPFPFFRGFASPGVGFLHYWAGIGALANQLLLGFFIIGVVVALAHRRRVIVAAALVCVGFALMSTITLGDPARYMSSHATPLVALLAIYGFRQAGWMRSIAVLAWILVLGGAHAAYFVMKMRMGG
jgi:hypothetical protein